MRVTKQHWALLLAPFVLGACGLLNVNVNGVVHKLGESDPEETAQNQSGSGSSGNGSSSGSGKSSSGKTAAKGEKEGHDQLRKDTRTLMNEMDKLLLESPEALPAAKISAMAAKQSAFEDAGLENEATYVAHLVTYYKLENAWRTDPAKAGEGLAKQLKGAVTTEGELTGKDKPVSFKFQAEAGKCYTFMSHMKMPGGDDDGASDFFLDGGKKGSQLQRFTMPERRTRGSGLSRRLAKAYTYGACALEATEITVTAKLKYAGTANGLRYAVIEHARDKFPKYLAIDMQPSQNDSCDAANWESFWTNPLPGSLVYGSKEPFLTYSSGTADEMWMTAWSAGQDEVRVMRKDIVGTPPKQFKFDDKPKFRKCPRKLENAHSPDGLKVAQCYAALGKRFDPQFDAAYAAKRSATTWIGEVNAQKRIEALNNQYDSEEDRTCSKLEAEVNKKFETAYNKIVDLFMTSPPKNAFDRADIMKRQYEGVAEIRCVGTHTCSF